MKRLIVFVLILSLALSCAACVEEAPPQTNFYYLRTQETILYGEPDALIAPVTRELSTDTPLDEALQLYLNGPSEETLMSPIPKGTDLITFIPREDMLILVLSREFSNLDGIGLTLAGACLCATCHSLTGQGRIQVRSGENIYDFDLSDFVFLDDSAGK